MLLEDEFQQSAHRMDRSTDRSTTVQHVPVRINIVSQSNGTGGYSPTAAEADLARVSDVFRPGAGIDFYVCGSVGIASDEWFNVEDQSEKDAIYNSSYYQRGVVNLFVVDDIGGANGYAYLPPGRAILVMRASRMATTTFEHEMGHIFHLYHTHEDEFGLENDNGDNCATAGDLLCDTEATPDLNGGGIFSCCPFGCVGAVCDYIGVCTDPNGDYYGSPEVDNYMSYGAYPSCRDRFSPMQLAKMNYTSLNVASRGAPVAISAPDLGSTTYAAGAYWNSSQINSAVDLTTRTPVPASTTFTLSSGGSVKLSPPFRYSATATNPGMLARISACP